jgi:hypothetical protein
MERVGNGLRARLKAPAVRFQAAPEATAFLSPHKTASKYTIATTEML